MKKNFIFLIVFFNSFFLGKASAALVTAEQVSGIWDKAGSPYIIENNITIAPDDTLIIEPGVRILFNPGVSLFVQGTLKAIGTVADSITFASTEADQFWGIILFENKTGKLSELRYCQVQHGSNIEELWEWGVLSIANLKTIISKCLIKNNKYDGIWCAYEGNQPPGVSVSLTNNVIKENGRYGIFTAAAGENVFICQKNIILRNGLDGIKFWLADGIFTNNVVAGNSGDGVFCYGSNIKIDLNTVSDNSGIGIHCDWNAVTSVSSSIVYGNGAGSIYLNVSEISISYSDIQNYWEGIGNISAEPEFISPATDDYHLLPSSPCIDGGDPSADYSNETEPNGHIVDMGAYGNTTEAAPSIPNSPEILSKVFKAVCWFNLFPGFGNYRTSRF